MKLRTTADKIAAIVMTGPGPPHKGWRLSTGVVPELHGAFVGNVSHFQEYLDTQAWQPHIVLLNPLPACQQNQWLHGENRP